MNWLIVVVVLAVVGAIIGACGANEGEKGQGAAEGALGCLFGGGAVIFELILSVAGIALAIWFVCWLFA